MAGALQFTLGLEVSNFLRGINLSSLNIISLSGAMEGLKFAAQKTWEQIERGGALNDLSNRTGESVGNLYKLQEAFKLVGLQDGNVAPMLLRMQRAMAGVDETGNKIGPLFRRMGLDLKDLQKQQSPEQIEALAGALAKLPKNQASLVASKIFGREGAGDIMQITRDFDAFKESLKDSDPIAKVFNRLAAAFDLIGDTIQTIKKHFDGMFVGIAEGVAPAIQLVLDLVKKIKFVEIGAQIGSVFTVISNAIKGGKVFELFNAGISASVEFGVNVISGTLGSASFWKGIWEVMNGSWTLQLGTMVSTFATFAANIVALLDTAMQKAMEHLGKGPFGAALGLGGFKALSFNENLRKSMADAKPLQQAGGVLAQMGLNEISGGMGDIGKAFRDAIANSGGPAQEALKALYQTLNISPYAEKGPPPPEKNDPIALSTRKAPEVTSWEKIGLSLRNFGDDSGRNTEQHTKNMLQQLKLSHKTLEKIAANPGGSFANRTA